MAKITVSEAYTKAKAYYKNRVQNAISYYRDQLKNIDLTYQAAALLAGEGFDVPEIDESNMTGFTLTIEAGDIPRVYKALGTVREEQYLRRLREGDERKRKNRKVVCTLVAEHYPTVKIEYLHDMPDEGEEGAKCRLVKRKSKAYTYTALVCDR